VVGPERREFRGGYLPFAQTLVLGAQALQIGRAGVRQREFATQSARFLSLQRQGDADRRHQCRQHEEEFEGPSSVHSEWIEYFEAGFGLVEL
jgi:hypothetical protein